MRRNALLFRLPAVLAFFESTNRTSDKGKKKKNAETPGTGLHYDKSSAHARLPDGNVADVSHF